MPDHANSSCPPPKPAAPRYPQTSGMAVAALIVSIFGISIVGLILGIVALRKINRSNGQLTGRGLALASIILSAVSLLICITVLVFLSLVFFGAWTLPAMLHQTQDPVVAHYGQKDEIRVSDLYRATMDLEILRSLGVERLSGAADLNAWLLMQVLYGNSAAMSYLPNQVKLAAAQEYLDLTPGEIDAFFADARQDSTLYWILLVAEAKAAGSTVSQEQALSTLKQVMSVLYPQEVSPAQIIDTLAAKQGVTSQRIIETFADLVTVFQYANQAAAGEIITAECVQFDAMKLAEKQPQPTLEEFAAQFETYKNSAAGQISEDNPYGFGYLLPKKVELNYILVKYEDILKQVAAPIQEDIEDYYQRNMSQFQESVLSDSNNPSSETVSKLRPFSEVAYQIKDALISAKARQIADRIMAEIQDMTHAEGSADFMRLAQSLSAMYNIPLSAGSTGIIDRQSLLLNEHIGHLFLEGPSGTQIPLDQWAFSVGADGAAASDESQAQANIEILSNLNSKAAVYISRVQLPQAASLESLDSEMSGVREQAIRDCKLLRAMDDMKKRAAQFSREVIQNGWQKAIDEYNLQSEDKVSLTSIAKRRYLSQPPQAEIVLAIQLGGTDLRQELTRAQDRKLADAFYAMIPADRSQAEDMAQVIDSEVCRSCYVVRNVSRKTVKLEDYAQKEPDEAIQLEFSGVRGFGIIHFRPLNILKRMNYRPVPVEKSELPIEANPFTPTSADRN